MKENPRDDPLQTVLIRNFDPEGARLIESSKESTKNAQAMLAWVAKQLRLGTPLDRGTAEFLAAAFDRAAKVAPSVAVVELGRRLLLAANNRRRKADPVAVVLRYYELTQGYFADAIPKRKAKDQVADEFGIDRRTVDRMIAKPDILE